MIALISLFIILILSITVVRIGATALELTGVSPEVASFQAQSAFSGAGFTTAESEGLVNHPVRRRIIRMLILLGSVGITSVIATVILTFTNSSNGNLWGRSGLLLTGLVLIYILARSQWLAVLMKKAIIKALSLNKNLQLQDYYEILGIAQGYSVSRMTIKADNWAAGRTLKELGLNKEGTLVLSIHRMDGGEEKFIVPNGDTVILPGDDLTVYGRCDGSECLVNRRKGTAGDKAHAKQCAEAKKMEVLQELEQA